jgi:hypothetical protein
VEVCLPDTFVQGLGPPRAPSAESIGILKRSEKEDTKRITLNKLLRYIEVKAAAREESRKSVYMANEKACQLQNNIDSDSEASVKASKRKRMVERNFRACTAGSQLPHQVVNIVAGIHNSLPSSSAIASFLDRALVSESFTSEHVKFFSFHINEVKRIRHVRHVDTARPASVSPGYTSGDSDLSIGMIFCDSSDDEEYQVTSVANGKASAYVVRTQQPHPCKDKQVWDSAYLVKKLNCTKFSPKLTLT